MTKSPLQFAKDFARLQGQLAALPPGDGRLLLALDFWQEMRELQSDSAYRSYFDEYLPLLMQLVEPANLTDLSIAELIRARSILTEIKDAPALAASLEIGSKLDLVIVAMAKVYFYVGAVEEGLAALPSPPTPLPLGEEHGVRDDNQDENAGEKDASPEGAVQNEFAALQTICARATETNHPLAATLNGILTDWQAEREAVYHDRARCLFVERDDSGRSVRGRLRTLVGKVDLFGKSARTDEITFDNAIKTPDDPFVGVAYSALAAVRKVFGGAGFLSRSGVPRSRQLESDVGQNPLGFDRWGVGKGSSLPSSMSSPRRRGSSPDPSEILDSRFRGNDKDVGQNPLGFDSSMGREPRAHDSDVGRGVGAPPLAVGLDARMSKPQGFRPTRSPQASHFYHAHYAIENSSQTFTGDSIGLAFGLLAYVQLLRPEVLRLDRLLSGEVAFTGGVDNDGKLTGVNDETLGQKIERAFFSPVKYVALPEANLSTAKQHLDRLRKLYPRRNLHLISAERLTDIMEDHNIVRSEKVCIGEFVAKKAAKYGRMAKVQVPLLLVLGYLLVCLIYPKAWVGFDRNPGSAVVNTRNNSLEAYNLRGQLLWEIPFTGTMESFGLSKVADLDGNGTNEVLYLPEFRTQSPERGWFYVYSTEGRLLFRRYCAVQNEYPGDSAGTLLECEHLNVVKDKARKIIVSEVATAEPTQSHVRLWSQNGDSVGWYINPGGTSFRLARDIDGDGAKELFFLNYNNRMNAVSLLVVRPDSARGVGPPYRSELMDLTGVKRGSQLAYVVFPVTDLGKNDLPTLYNHPGIQGIREDNQDEIKVYVSESPSFEGNCCVIYHFNYALRLTKVIVTDQFTKRRQQLVDDGRLKQVNEREYLELIRNSALYWTPDGWVTEGELRAQGR